MSVMKISYLSNIVSIMKEISQPSLIYLKANASYVWLFNQMSESLPSSANNVYK